MKIHRIYIGYSLYVISFLMIAFIEIWLVWMSREFIIAGKGMPGIGVLYYYIVAFFSTLLWIVSYVFNPNKKLAILFWVVLLAIVPIIIFQPLWWAAPLNVS